jgi:hypothetical protein
MKPVHWYRDSNCCFSEKEGRNCARGKGKEGRTRTPLPSLQCSNLYKIKVPVVDRIRTVGHPSLAVLEGNISSLEILQSALPSSVASGQHPPPADRRFLDVVHNQRHHEKPSEHDGQCRPPHGHGRPCHDTRRSPPRCVVFRRRGFLLLLSLALLATALAF